MKRGRDRPDGEDDPVASRAGVKATYDRIASHFAETRPEPWPEVETFLEGRSGDVGLDLGVGNARHAELLSGRCTRVLGVDASRGALSTGRERANARSFDVALIAADVATLPLRDRCVDVAVYVATIHHLPSRPLRIASLNELSRVLRPGGRAIVSAWSVNHRRFDAETAFDTTVGWTLPDGEVVDRFYHIYDLSTFERDVDASGLARVSSYESGGNCYAEVEGEQ